jgi:DNA primase
VENGEQARAAMKAAPESPNCRGQAVNNPRHMRYPPPFLDEIRARLPVSQVAARKVQLKRAGREFKGLSPFKVEKTASFFVNDQKGFYHCFASGEHGDIFTFVMKTEGLSFPEAVERLANEAGLPMPKLGPREEQRTDERARLHAVMEEAQRFFEERLKSAEGAEARRYLEKRSLRRETIARFRLGYAPHSRLALKAHLAHAGFTPAEMAASGMLIAGEDIPVPYDRFRHRVMFPITDLKGRVIAFGGRALEPKAPAKYLNSPETPLFHKGTVLFNAAGARQYAHDRGQMIVVEGYMDVLALSEAGFDQAVAPLGTALTEEQVTLLWRMVPVPVLCFDGDSAGRKAAFRAVDTVLPQLKPGFSVAFAFLEGGLDPDDLIRQQGPQAFASTLQRTRTLFDVLWEREEMRFPLVTPEERASFEVRLKALAMRIADPTVRGQYEKEVKETLWARNRLLITAVAGNAGRRAGAETVGRQRRNNAQLDWRIRERARLGLASRRSGLAPSFVSNELAKRSGQVPQREALLMRTLLNHPWLLEEHAEEIAALPFTAPGLIRLRDGLLMLQASDNSLDRHELRSQLEGLSLDKAVDLVERAVTHKSDKFAEADADRAEVETGWRHALALHKRQLGLRKALEAAERAWHEEGSEDALARICEIQRLMAGSEATEASPEHG